MNKNTVYLLILTVILAIAVFMILQDPSEKNLQVAERGKLVDFDSSAIDKIELWNKNGFVSAIKTDGIWTLDKPLKYIANRGMIANALNMCSNMHVKNIVTSQQEKHNKFAVDTAAVQMKFWDGEELQAHVFIGKSGSGFNDSYVRLAESDEVALVSGPLAYAFTGYVSAWRDRILFEVPKDKIREIEFKSSNNSYSLIKNNGDWTIDGEETDSASTATIVNLLSKFYVDDFLDEDPKIVPGYYATIVFNDIKLDFYKPELERKYLIKKDDSKMWFVLNQNKTDMLLKAKNTLLKKQ